MDGFRKRLLSAGKSPAVQSLVVFAIALWWRYGEIGTRSIWMDEDDAGLTLEQTNAILALHDADVPPSILKIVARFWTYETATNHEMCGICNEKITLDFTLPPLYGDGTGSRDIQFLVHA